MKRKYLNTLAALAFLAALWGGLSYYDKYKAHVGSKIDSKPEEKIFSLDISHIRSFTLKPRDGEQFTCARQGGKWGLVEPKKLPADETAVSSFLNSLTTATVSEVVDPHAANLKDFGLDSPAETLEVSTDAKPPKFTLLLGDETPTGGGVYAQIGGAPRVITLASYEKTSLEKKLFDMRDKRTVTLDADKIQRIDMEAKGKKWTLEKNPEGVWDLVLPPAVRADRFTVDGLVSQLRALSMQSIAEEDKKGASKFGFRAPALRLRLSGPGGSQTLILGKKDGDRYDAMNSALDPIFTVGSDILTQFQKDPSDLRDKDLFSFSTFDVKHFEVDTPKGHWAFDHEKDKWKETAPKFKQLGTEKVESLLDDIHALRAESFPKNRAKNLAAFGLVKPVYKFQVQFGEKNQKEFVEASKLGDHVYARRSTDSLPCELSKTALDPIEKALSEL